MPEHVYIARSSRLLKVGHSHEPKNRVRGQRCPETGERLWILFTVAGLVGAGRRAEREVQRAIAHLLRPEYGREWFTWDESVLPKVIQIIAKKGHLPVDNIGRKLRTKRVARDVTQVQLAKALGVTQAALSMIEDGKFQPADELHGKILRWIAGGGGIVGKAPRGANHKG